MRILSVDYGTSSLKLSVLDEDLKTLASASVGYDYNVENGDWITIEADNMYASLVAGMKKLEKYAPEIDIIAYDTFSPSLTFMDAEGNPLFPIITHLDRRAKEQSKQIVREMGSKHYQSITGIFPFTGGASVTTVMWMLKYRPEVLAKTVKFGHLNTWVYKKLTGIFVTEQTNASMMGMYETIKETGWAEEIVKTFKIPKEKLPEIAHTGDVLGTLLPGVAKELGMKAGIPVVLGGNDAATAHLGAGNFNAGDILNTVGSSEIITILSDKPVINDKYYLRKAVNKGMWQLFAITLGGFAIDWFKNSMYENISNEEFFDVVIPRVMAKGKGKSEVKFFPHLAGDRQSLMKKRGSFTGMTLDTTKDDLLMALFYGINEPIRQTVEIARRFITINDPIKVTGGLTRIKGYMELKKEILGGFDFKAVDDCPILGNGVMAREYLQKGK